MNNLERLNLYLTRELKTADDPALVFLEDEIERINKNLNSEVLNFKKLNLHRIFSSNTLRNQGGLHIDNWNKANLFLLEKIQKNCEVSFDLVRKINSFLIGEEREIRTHPIFATNLEFVPPTHLKNLVGQFEKMLSVRKNPLYLSFEIYLWLVTLHPFSDCNGRTSRLCADFVLIKSGYLPLCFESPIATFLAQSWDGPTACKNTSYKIYLNGLLNSYSVATG